MNAGPKALRQTITLRPLAPDRGDDSLNNQDGEVPGSILQYTWNRNNNDDTRHQYRVEVTAHCELFENASKWLRMDNQVLLGYSDLDHELDQTSYATDPSGFNYKAPNDLSPLRFATQGDGSARVPLFLKNTSRTTNQNKAIYASHQGRFLDDRVDLLLGAPRFDPTRDIVYNVSNFSPSQAPGGSNGGSAKLDTGAAYAAWESGVGSGAIFQSTEGNGALTWYVNASRPEGAAFLDAAFAANQADFGAAWLGFLYQGESGDSLVNNATMDTMAFHGNGSNNAALLLTDESEGYDAQVLIKVLKNFEMILNGAITEVQRLNFGQWMAYPHLEDAWAVWNFQNGSCGLLGLRPDQIRSTARRARRPRVRQPKHAPARVRLPATTARSTTSISGATIASKARSRVSPLDWAASPSPLMSFRAFVPLPLSMVAALGVVAAPIRVLIVDGYSNHDWQLTTALIRDIIEPTGLFQVIVSTTPAAVEDPGWNTWSPDFAAHDVVIQTCNDINGGPPWPRAVQDDFESFVRNGGGVYVWRSGNNAFADWPAYNEMIGLGWQKGTSAGRTP